MSKFVTLCGFQSQSSGGAELNFEIIGGTTQPSHASENTIWVNTNQRITSWVFSTAEPENPEEGMVWWCTGDYSSAPFNALENNVIQVYAIGCKQYISGKFIDVPCKIYQSGEWNIFTDDVYLLDKGVYDSSVEKTYSYGVHSFSANTNGITVTGTYQNYAGGGCDVAFAKKYNFSPFSKMEINVSSVHGTEGGILLSVSKARTFSNANNVAHVNLLSTGIRTVDLSDINGEYYVVIHTEGYPSYVGITLNQIALRV